MTTTNEGEELKKSDIVHEYNNDKYRARLDLTSNYLIRPEKPHDFYLNHYCNLNLSKTAKIVEFGSGLGHFWERGKSLLSDESNLLLSDFSEKMLEKTRENIAPYKLPGNISFAVADIEKLIFDNNSFDLAIAHMMIYHVNPELAVNEVSRVLAKNGLFCVSNVPQNREFVLFELMRSVGIEKYSFSSLLVESDHLEALLKSKFTEVNKCVYKNATCWKSADTVIEFAKSLIHSEEFTIAEDQYRALHQAVSDFIKTHGSLSMNIQHDLFICRL
jgi:ubiquinone/menaquinone biosynthesis C-methylase UbiE